MQKIVILVFLLLSSTALFGEEVKINCDGHIIIIDTTKKKMKYENGPWMQTQHWDSTYIATVNAKSNMAYDEETFSHLSSIVLNRKTLVLMTIAIGTDDFMFHSTFSDLKPQPVVLRCVRGF